MLNFESFRRGVSTGVLCICCLLFPETKIFAQAGQSQIPLELSSSVIPVADYDELFMDSFEYCIDEICFRPILPAAIGSDSEAEDAELDLIESGEDSLLDLSLEELANEPVVVVVSASRKPEEKSHSSVPITVITKEDIHYSGLTNIAEILQFAPGVDFLKINRYLYAVGVHGLHETVSDRIKVLIDGREADSPIFGGPEFYLIPVQTEDIERIEIVRAPAGPVWGANAFTGLVNIITKRPKDVQGLFESTTVTEFGDTYNHLRYGSKYNDWYWKFSLGYDDQKSSKDALGNDTKYYAASPTLDPIVAIDRFDVHDNARVWKFDFEAENDVDEFFKMNFGVGHTNFRGGDYAQFGYQIGDQQRCELTRIFAKLDYDCQDGSVGTFQWFSNIHNIYKPNSARYDAIENSVEFLFNNELENDHALTWGGSFSWYHINTGPRADGLEIFTDDSFDEYMAGLFLMDDFYLQDNLKLETQIRGDWYSETEADVSARLSGVYFLNDEKDKILRLGAARAVRSPLSSLQKVAFTPQTLSGIPFPVELLEPGELDNEQSYSFELGYEAKLRESLTFSSNFYYQLFEDLIGYAYTPNGLGTAEAQARNIDGAQGWGSDLELKCDMENSQLSLWYSYNDFEEDSGGQCVRAYLPARHKAGVGYRLFLEKDWALNLNYRFQDTTKSSPGVLFETNYPSYNRLDLNISKRFAKGDGELMLGVTDLLNGTRDGAYEMSTFVTHDVPGRTFFVRFQYKF